MTAPTHNEPVTAPAGPILDVHDPRLQAAVATGLISAILFVVRLVTHADVPSWIGGAIATVVPAAVAWLFAHFAWNRLPPGAVIVKGKHEQAQGADK